MRVSEVLPIISRTWVQVPTAPPNNQAKSGHNSPIKTMRRRLDIKEQLIKVACPKCFAAKNRRCTRLMNPHRGEPMKMGHNERIEAYLLYERESNPPLSDVPVDALKSDQIVRCQDTGRFGKLRHIHRSDESAFLIVWDNGVETRCLQQTATKILCWRETLVL
jgi:hypothetical protein